MKAKIIVIDQGFTILGARPPHLREALTACTIEWGDASIPENAVGMAETIAASLRAQSYTVEIDNVRTVN